MNPSPRFAAACSALLLMLLGPAADTRGQGGVSVEPTRAARNIRSESPAERDARMRWWREARFGLFIHWGVYAATEGRYGAGSHYGEWIMLHARIPRAKYRAFAQQFNPTNYDPVAWARLAKRAGMRYAVITAKHHEGFALYPSAVTDWDIADASPHGHDLLAPLGDAMRAEGLKFGLYYSQAMDWMHPGGAIVDKPWDPTHKGDFGAYIEQIALPQVKELIARYEPDVLWWDTPRQMTPELAGKFAALLRPVTSLIMNNRLGGGYAGDFDTPEQFVPLFPPTRDWETCMTMNGVWGYNAADQNWKSVETLIRTLAETSSKGGNFLLNVGPMANGEIPQPSIERLEAVGRWLAANGESIYGTTAGPFVHLSWGAATRKGDRIYLHVFHWPADGRLRVPLQSKTRGAHLLVDPGTPLPMTVEQERVSIQLPAQAPDPINSIVVLDLAEPPRATPPPTLHKPVTASSQEPNAEAANAVDGLINTTWYPEKSEQRGGATLEIDLQAEALVAGYGLGEADVWPRLKQRYTIELRSNGEWKHVAAGTTDGHGRRGAFPAMTADAARLHLSGANGRAGLAEFHLFSPE